MARSDRPDPQRLDHAALDRLPPAPRPLDGFARLHSSDSERVALIAGKAFSPHRMGVDRGGRLDARLNILDFGRSRLAYIEYRAPVSIISSSPLDYYAVNLPLAGAARVQSLRAGDIASNPTRAAVISPVDQVHMRWSEDLGLFCVRIDPQALRQHARLLTPNRLPPELRFLPELSVSSPAGSTWMQVLNLVRATADRCGPAGVPGPLARQLEQMVMSTLLLVQPSSWSDALHSPAPAVGQSVVRALAERMRAEPDTIATVAEAASAAQLSVRTLQEGFRRQFGVSPGQFLAEARLDRAQSIIEEELPVPASVAEVAYRVGYPHLGRFAKHYRERFGITPSEALRVRRRCSSGVMR